MAHARSDCHRTRFFKPRVSGHLGAAHGLLAKMRMLIRRCAWHLKYRGYRIVFGVASWRGFHLRFTDGLCGRCVVRHRSEWRAAHGIPDDPPAPRPGIDGGRTASVLVALAALVLAARPLDHGTRLMSFIPAASRPAISPANVASPAAPAAAAPTRRGIHAAARPAAQSALRTAPAAPARGGDAGPRAVFRRAPAIIPAGSSSPLAARQPGPSSNAPVGDAGSHTQAP
jgi:hypothetical protein